MEIALESPAGDYIKSLNLLSQPRSSGKGEQIKRYLVIRTYRGDEYTFFGLPHQLKELHTEILNFVSMSNRFNSNEVAFETSGSEDFQFEQFELPCDVAKTVREARHSDEPVISGLLQRRYKIYKSKVKQERKFSGVAQIRHL